MNPSQITPMPGMGMLNWPRRGETFQLTRHAPSGPLSEFVKHYWIVCWDLQGQEPYPQEVIPNPCVNLVVEPGRSAVFGPSKQKFSYLLKDRGCVFGVKFKPGGFYPFLRKPVSLLAEHPLSFDELFGVDARTVERAILSQLEEASMVQLMEQYLLPLVPPPDENIERLGHLIDRIMEDPELIRVDQAAELLGVGVRKLQRLFQQYVGVSPKWVIQLYRLQNAAETMDQGRHLDGLKLSLDLGYHDQAHFIKHFKAVVGRTPDEYAAQQQQQQRLSR